jgi:hypothetical protein
MPLAFPTRDRGPIAFGFFNVDSDMLLLDRHFFFADALCREWVGVAEGDPAAAFDRRFPVWTIRDSAEVGDLMGAIHGVRFTGFIGATYRRHPFPARPEDFRQSPDGRGTQVEFRELIRPFAIEEEIGFSGTPPDEVAIGDYLFSREIFGDLVRYVWRGGWPRWRDDVRPDYVLALARAIGRRRHWLFEGLESGC